MKRLRILPIILIVSLISILILGAMPSPIGACDIDIKPGSDPNAINLKAKGVTPVAIFATSNHSVDIIDPSTVRFQSAPAVKWSFKDVNGDGLMDMVFHFKIQDLVGLSKSSTVGILTWETFSGDSFTDYDSVKIVG